MKRSIFVVFVILFSFLFVVAGCVAPKAETEPAPEQQATIVWRWQDYYTSPESGVLSTGHWFAEQVAERSGGRMRVDVFPAGTLGYSGFELARVCARGMVDVTVPFEGQLAADNPAFAIIGLPFLFLDFTVEEGKYQPALAEAEARPILERMASDLNLVYFGNWTYPEFLLSKDKVLKVEDWRGLKMRSWSEVLTNMAEALGASGISIPWTEQYTAFATGVADSVVGGVVMVQQNKLWEVLNYEIFWPVSPTTECLVANPQSLASLPPDLRDMVTELLEQVPERCWMEDVYKPEQSLRPILEDKGFQFLDVDSEEVAKVKAIVEEEVWQEYLERGGEDAAALLEIYLKYA